MEAVEVQRMRNQGPAIRASLVAHLFGMFAIFVMLVWLLKFRGGMNLYSAKGALIFNVHPFLMFCGYIFLAGQAMMAYRSVNGSRKVQKLVHMFLHLTATVLGIVGLHAVFKFHNQENIPNMYSFHSWIGLITFIFYCLQWVVGLGVFLFPGAPMEIRARTSIWHVCSGRVLLFMLICTALTGLMEKATFLKLQQSSEGRLVNVLGLLILLFGISVDLSVSLARYA